MTYPTLCKMALGFYLVLSLTAMGPMNVGFIPVALAWIYIQFQKRPGAIQDFSSNTKDSYQFWGWSLLVSCWLSLALIQSVPMEYAGHAPEVTLHGFQKIWYLIIPGIVFTIHGFAQKEKPVEFGTFIKPWWIMSSLLLIIAIIQFYTGWPLAQKIPTNPGRFHAILFFGHHLSTSSVIIFPTFTALAVAFGLSKRHKSESYGFQAKLAWITGISGIMILFLSYARTAWLAILLGMGILLQQYFGRHLNRKKWALWLMAIILSLGAFSQTSFVKERIVRLIGVNERVLLWKANLDFFQRRPFSGIGWLKTQEMSQYYFQSIDPEHYRSYFWGHAHNNFLEMLGGTGMLGFIAFLGWSWFTLLHSFRLSRDFNKMGKPELADFSFGIFTALILLHFNGLTNVTFWEGKVMHQQMIAVGFILILDRIRKSVSPESKNQL